MIYHTGIIPESATVSNVVPIFNKDNTADPGDYRGIALIEVLAKQLTAFVAGQATVGLNHADFFAKSQGGFRSGEESVSQFAALWEVCTRRRV